MFKDMRLAQIRDPSLPNVDDDEMYQGKVSA